MDDALTLPCLHTVAPAAAATRQAMVDTLSALVRRLGEPPVPTMSMVPTGSSSGSAAASIAPTMPATSSTVSPLTRNATMKADSWAAVASPARIDAEPGRSLGALEVLAVDEPSDDGGTTRRPRSMAAVAVT